MAILVLAPGSRGDIVPAARLAHDFCADGHEVTILAEARYADEVARAGAQHAPFTASMAPEPAADGKPAGVRAHLDALRGYMSAAATVASAAAPGHDLIVANAISPYGHDLAEGMGVPSVEALLQPADPSADYPPMIASGRDLGRIGNRLAGRAARLVSAPYDGECARIRSEFGLPKEHRRAAQQRRRAAGLPVHHAISPAVLPRPADWPANLTLDGFWWPIDAVDASPVELAAFLDAGPAPVVVTLGSLPAGSTVTEAVADAIRRRSTTRFIVQGSEFAELSAQFETDRVVTAGPVDHAWLLPRAAAVVHQAGAGVTSAALRAGVASVTVPIHTDQPFWARRLAELGAGTAPIPAKSVTGEALAEQIGIATEPAQLTAGARRVRDAMAADPGTAPLRRWIADQL